MAILIIIALAFAAFWWWSMIRGRLLVRASTYLMHMTRPDATPELCNGLALSIDLHAAKELMPGSLYHCRELFNGHQLSLISEARLRGFRG